MKFPGFSLRLGSLGYRYGIAVALLGLTLIAQWLLNPHFGNRFAGVLLLFAVLLVSWLGGFGPAVLVGLAGLGLMGAFFPSPAEDSGDLAGPLLFLLITLGMALTGAVISRGRRRAEIAAEELRTTLLSIADAVIVTNRDGAIITMNPVAEALTDWAAREAIGQPLPDVFVIVHEDTRLAAENPVLQSLTAGVVIGMAKHTLLIGRSGRECPVDHSAAPIRSSGGDTIGCVLVFRDVTERRRAEEALRRSQEELQLLAARLSEADRRKDVFLATLAHELRNPLAPIVTGLEIMKLPGTSSTELADIRGMMERQTQQLITIVDDLLDVSRITRGKFELRTCELELQEVIRSAVEASRPVIDQARHHLTLDVPDEPIRLRGDPHRLAQVFSNLLNNAAKYTPEGGQIALRVAANPSQVAVAVQDSGIGIPVENQQKVFEMFGQLEHPIQRGGTGLGIGLTLVKSLVEMHGGTIEVHSEGEGQGSQFIVRLPLPSEVTAAETPLPPYEASEPMNYRVLVIDDNQDAAQLLSVGVRTLGNEVRVAYDGQEAIEIAEQFLPDVVLMDIGMPRLNGFQTARMIRQQPWGAHMVLIAMTGWGQEEDRERSREAGFDHHLVKPAELKDVQRLLAALERRGQLPEVARSDVTASEE